MYAAIPMVRSCNLISVPNWRLYLVCAARAHLLAAKDRQNAAQDAAEPSSPTQPDRHQDRGDPGRGAATGDNRGARVDEKRRDGVRQPRGEASHYLDDVKSSRAQMRRPSDSSSLSWRSVHAVSLFVWLSVHAVSVLAVGSRCLCLVWQSVHAVSALFGSQFILSLSQQSVVWQSIHTISVMAVSSCYLFLGGVCMLSLSRLAVSPC